MAAAEVDADVGDVEPAPGEQLRLLDDVRDRVLDEALELGADVALGLLVGRPPASRACGGCPVATTSPPTRSSSPTIDTAAPSAHGLHHLDADVVEQRDAGGGEQQRPDVRVAPGDRRRRVDDGGRCAARPASRPPPDRGPRGRSPRPRRGAAASRGASCGGRPAPCRRAPGPAAPASARRRRAISVRPARARSRGARPPPAGSSPSPACRPASATARRRGRRPRRRRPGRS